MKNIIQGVKGAREFYPIQMRNRNFILKHIREVSHQFGYEEYDGPFLEKVDLYAAKSGEELVKEQAFVFPDRGGELITLRPELTPSLARMVAEKQNELIFPLRWWSFGPFWRYEKPQKGRTREFFQWNIDLIGIDSAYADAELVSICASFFNNIGLDSTQVTIFVNHRQLMDEEIKSIGITDVQKKKVFKLIDRIDKMPPEVWDTLVLEEGLNQAQLVGLKNIINNKELWKKSQDLVKIFEILEIMGLKGYVQYNPRIIRGLDYYTGMVFEAWDTSGEGRAVLGGGHYNNLVGDVGGEPLPGVGFAMGDVMAGFLLEKYGCLKSVSDSEIDVLVTTFDEDSISQSFKILKELHNNKINAVPYPQVAKLQKQIKYADRMGIKVVIILGPSELETGTVTIKNLALSSQITVPNTQLIESVQILIAQQ